MSHASQSVRTRAAPERFRRDADGWSLVPGGAGGMISPMCVSGFFAMMAVLGPAGTV